MRLPLAFAATFWRRRNGVTQGWGYKVLLFIRPQISFTCFVSVLDLTIMLKTNSDQVGKIRANGLDHDGGGGEMQLSL